MISLSSRSDYGIGTVIELVPEMADPKNLYGIGGERRSWGEAA